MKVLISHNGSELKYPILYTIFLDYFESKLDMLVQTGNTEMLVFY